MTPRPDLTFDRFTPTRGLRRAVELGIALAEDAGNAPRLLLLHGPAGVGKTHLLHAILNHRAARQPWRSWIQVEARYLVEQWIAALRGDAEADVPGRLERADLVAIDDLHTLAGKPVTQGEVARTLERTVSHGGRVVCAMGASPAELPVFAEALRRLPEAHFVSMQPPHSRDLRYVLTVMARAGHLPLPRQILAAIAQRCEGDVRRGQGELARWRFEQSHPFGGGSLLTEKP